MTSLPKPEISRNPANGPEPEHLNDQPGLHPELDLVPVPESIFLPNDKILDTVWPEPALKSVSKTILEYLASSPDCRRAISGATGVPESTLSRFVAGKRGLDGTTIDKLAKHFKLELRPKADKKGK